MTALEVVGWSLLHSVWQGALVAALLWVLLRVIRDTLPRVRYVAGLVALTVLLCLPVLNYRETMALWRGHRSWLVSTADHVIRGQLAEGRPDPDAVTAELRRRHASVWADDVGPVALVAERGRELARAVAWLWLAGVLLLGARLVRDGRRARALSACGAPDPGWRAASRAVAARLGVGRPVRVRLTDRVDVPALVGWRWPVVLVPAAARAGPEAMGAILAHELAHVRRHDALVNLIQAVAEVLLFYNPAAWWISARVGEERECSCDAIAIPAVEGGAARYVRTLLAMESSRRAGAAALALTGGSLVRRIRRVHAGARDPRGIHWPRAAAALLVAGMAWAHVPAPRSPVPLAARVSALSLMQQDLEGMQVVVRTVRLPGRPASRAPAWFAG